MFTEEIGQSRITLNGYIPNCAFSMEKKDKDIALFVAFCIEEYGATKGMSGKQVLDLFSQYGVTDYLCNCFEPLHTQGRQWLVADIDEFIEINKKNK